jgi:acyl carrier protein
MQDPATETLAANVRRAVTETFISTAQAQAQKLQPLTDDLVLVDSGLDSLCFAIIVAQLEEDLGVDPFSDFEDAFFPVSFGEFVRLYEAAAQRMAA